MAFRPWKTFLDTSALIAGIISSKGAAREILLGGEAGFFEILLSSQVLLEADRNIQNKFPHFIAGYRNHIRSCAPTLVEDPTRHEIDPYIPMVGSNDAPILAAAIKASASFLVTWNTRDFMKPSMPKDLPIKILTPDGFIEEWKKLLEWSE